MTRIRTQELPVLLTATRAELGQRCWRRHGIADILCRHTYKSPSALFGNVAHKWARVWWETRDAVLTLEATQEEYALQLPEGHAKMTLNLALGMAETYIKRAKLAGPLLGDWVINELEERFETRVGEFIYSWQSDRLLTKGYEFAQFDTKTAARIDDRWRRGWVLSLQQRLYMHGIREVYGKLPDHVVIEGLEKRPGADPVYLQVPVVEAMVDEAVATFLHVARKDEAALQASMVDGVVDLSKLEDYILTTPDMNYQDCNSYNTPCAYLPLCNAEPGERSVILHEEYKVVPPDYTGD